MTCYYPLTAWKSRDPEDWNNGKARMVFQKEKGLPGTETKLPCGQCSGCRLARSRTWAVRCLHEASLHDQNCFVTLTYNDENLPAHGSLNKRDFVLFMKRLRKRFGDGIRFFQCGEYGELLSRPHHHAIFFGLDFVDKLLYSSAFDTKLYYSETLTSIWGKGFTTIGDVTFDSAAYVARYIMKKINGPYSDLHYKGRLPEYITMSRRPGIGRDWYEKFKDDLYNHDKCVVRPNFICKPPKYYDYLFDINNPEQMKSIKSKRKEAVADLPEKDYKRLQTLEKLQHLKSKRISRRYEDGNLP